MEGPCASCAATWRLRVCVRPTATRRWTRGRVRAAGCVVSAPLLLLACTSAGWLAGCTHTHLLALQHRLALLLELRQVPVESSRQPRDGSHHSHVNTACWCCCRPAGSRPRPHHHPMLCVRTCLRPTQQPQHRRPGPRSLTVAACAAAWQPAAGWPAGEDGEHGTYNQWREAGSGGQTHPLGGGCCERRRLCVLRGTRAATPSHRQRTPVWPKRCENSFSSVWAMVLSAIALRSSAVSRSVLVDCSSLPARRWWWWCAMRLLLPAAGCCLVFGGAAVGAYGGGACVMAAPEEDSRSSRCVAMQQHARSTPETVVALPGALCSQGAEGGRCWTSDQRGVEDVVMVVEWVRLSPICNGQKIQAPSHTSAPASL